MKREIGDKAAIEFAVGFYDALGAGKTIEQAFKFGRSAIELQGIPEHLTPALKINPNLVPKEVPPPPNQQSRIFISYKHDVVPDDGVATELSNKLKEYGYYVFIDKDIEVGTEWVERINQEIQNADFMIAFLSEYSVQSEMVKEEIEKAHYLAKEQNGRPRILPVRMKYRAKFQSPLSKYLNHIHWAIWDEPADTPRLIDELVNAIAGNALSISPENHADFIKAGERQEIPAPFYAAPLEMPEGTIDIESKFYLERPTDKIALDAIERQGVTITIKAPRQMGKSSLLIRIIEKTKTLNKRTISLDFQQFDKPSLENADLFYTQFCAWITDELELEDKVDEYWNMKLSNSMRCTRYMQRHVLRQINNPVLLAMDEVETIFDTDFQSDFFGMLRSWHNQRSTGSIWKNLDLALVTSTEPYQLIKDLNQSPFNVGEIVDLKDFTADQISDLNKRHGMPFNEPQQKKLMELLHGHPYLVRKAMYLVASKRYAAEEFFATATDDRGPFGDHLRYHLFRIHDQKDLVERFLQIIEHNTSPDDWTFRRLEGCGLVRKEGKIFLTRSQLYYNYFKERLHV